LLLLASPAAAETLVGVAGPMSGSYAVFGAQMKAGAERAVADINAAGGVLGQSLALSVGDDLCDRKQADAVANQMAGRGIVFMAGHLCTGASLAAATVYSESGIVQMSPGATGADFTDRRAGPGVFRLAGRDDAEGAAIAAFIAARFKDSRVALLRDDSAYGTALADEVGKALFAEGIRPLISDQYRSGDRDFSAVVSRLAEARADLLVVAGYPTEAGLLAAEIRRQGLATAIVGGDALMSDEYWRNAAEAGDGTYVAYPPDPASGPAATKTVAAFRAAGIEPAGFVLPTYAALQIWSSAAAQAGTVEAAAVAAAIASGSFDTVLGRVRFNAKGDAELPSFVLYQWKAGRPVPVGH
jgi:branched-chain amino acid transport system substrate-binding protein